MQLSLQETVDHISALLESNASHDALEQSQKALKLYPHVAMLWHLYGLSLRQMGEIELSLSAFLRATEIHPDLGHAWLNLGICHVLKNDVTNAEIALEKAHHLLPDNANALYYMAVVYQHQKRFDLAREYYEKVLITQPNNLGVMINLSHLFVGLS